MPMIEKPCSCTSSDILLLWYMNVCVRRALSSLSLSAPASYIPTLTHWIAISASINHHHVRAAILFEHFGIERRKRRFVRFRQTTYYSSRSILKESGGRERQLLFCACLHTIYTLKHQSMKWDENIVCNLRNKRLTALSVYVDGSKRERERREEKRERRWEDRAVLYQSSASLNIDQRISNVHIEVYEKRMNVDLVSSFPFLRFSSICLHIVRWTNVTFVVVGYSWQVNCLSIDRSFVRSFFLFSMQLTNVSVRFHSRCRRSLISSSLSVESIRA